MAISAFIPDIWSARFQDNLNKRLAYGSVFGRDHQGESAGRRHSEDSQVVEGYHCG